MPGASYTHHFNARVLKWCDHLVSRARIGDQHMQVRRFADAPPGDISEFAGVDDGDTTPGDANHCGIQAGLVGAQATGAPLPVDGIRADEQRVDEHLLQALDGRRSYQQARIDSVTGDFIELRLHGEPQNLIDLQSDHKANQFLFLAGKERR